MRNSAGFDLWETVDSLRDAFAPRPSGRMARGDVRGKLVIAAP